MSNGVDIELSNSYKKALANTDDKPALETSRQNWVQGIHQEADKEKLLHSYYERIYELNLIAAGCDKVETIDWTNKRATIDAYEKCISSWPDIDKSTRGFKPIKKLQTDSMLYLAYIYLGEGKYNNMPRANLLMTEAIKDMGADCQDAHGTYDNFCYLVYFKEDIPKNFQNQNDALKLLQFSLPCFYLDMIKENPAVTEYMDSHFGSSRDASVPGICGEFSPYDIIPLKDFMNLESYKNIEKLNPNSFENGTMRFAVSRSNYKKMVELLLFPKQTMEKLTPAEININIEAWGERGQEKLLYAKDLESEIRKYKDLSDAYDNITSKIDNYYRENSDLDNTTAQNYARTATQLIVLYNLLDQ